MRKTKYPIIFIHGATVGRHIFSYTYNRLYKYMQKIGFNNFFVSRHDAFDSIVNNANEIKKLIFNVLKNTGTDKVNLIGYSRGGLEARYIACLDEMKDKIASVSLYATPNYGMIYADYMLMHHLRLVKNSSFFLRIIYRLCGDKRCNPYLSCLEMSSSNVHKFNLECPDVKGVYYQSFLTQSSNKKDDFWLRFFRGPTDKISNEPSDGMIHVSTASWGHFHLFDNNAHMTHLNVIGIGTSKAKKSIAISNLFYIINCLVEKGL